MRLKFLFILCILFSTNLVIGQKTIEWSTLMDVSFKDIYLESEDIYVYFPIFDETHKKLDSKEVEITGYIIPLDVEANMYFLSAYPFSACFFCGNAGPESVMAVNFAKRTTCLQQMQTFEMSMMYQHPGVILKASLKLWSARFH